MKKILFVCMGNICRSPTAEGVFRSLVASQNLSGEFVIDSAGTHAFHIGNAPDPRARQYAKQRGINLDSLKARQVCVQDFDEFDYVIAMDGYNRELLLEHAPKAQQHKVVMMMQYASTYSETEVPDPYYGGDNGFERVLDMLEDAATGLLKQLES